MNQDIREQIKKEENIPQVIEERIEMTLKSLRQEQKIQAYKRSAYKKIKKMGLVAVVVMSLSGFTFATMNHGLEKLFKCFKPMESQNYEQVRVELDNVKELPEKKNKTFAAISAVNQGMTVQIQEMAFDGTQLICKYEIEANNVTFPYELGALFAPHTYAGEHRIECIEMVESIGRWTSSNIYEGYYTVYFNQEKLKEEELNEPLKLGITEVFEIRGDWTIETNVCLKDIYKKPKIYMINQSVYIQGLEVKIEELKIGAFTTQLIYTIYNVPETENMKQFEKLRFFVLDEQGRCLNYQDEAQSEWSIINGEESIEYHNVKGKMNLMPFKEMTKTLTIIPFMNYSYQITGTEEITLDEEQAKVFINKDLYLDIQNIRRDENSICFEYTYEGLIPERMGVSFAFLDQEGNDVTIRDNCSMILDYQTGIYSVIYHAPDAEVISKIQIDRDFDCEVLKDESFTVTLVQ